jgi:hypothetical protein
MQRVTFENRVDFLNAVEIIKDYVRKVSTQLARFHVHHEQDADGCSTLVLHVVGPNVPEDKSVADFLEQLKSITAEVESLVPKPTVPSEPAAESSSDIEDSEIESEQLQ